MLKAGIVGYGAYIPRYRIKVSEIARIWKGEDKSIEKNLGISEKTVSGYDEDTATMAVEAARQALDVALIDPKEIGAVYVGSESHPYTVKPTATIVAEAIDASVESTAADFEFACKAGTAAIQTCMGMVLAGMIDYGLAIGSDTAQSAPGDPLEYTAAAGGVAYIIGKRNCLASIEETFSYTTDTPDFWRREGQSYPSHGGRFTGLPAYFKHVYNASQGLMDKLGLKPEDFDYAVFHQPNGKFPRSVAKMLGLEKEQIKDGILIHRVGNLYSGSSLLGLARVLDIAKPGDRILLTSFGSGAGSDSFSIRVEDKIGETRGRAPTVEELIGHGRYVDYATYARMKKKIKV